MVGSHPQLALGAYHPARFDSSYFRPTQLALRVWVIAIRVVELCTDTGERDALAGSHIRRAAHYFVLLRAIVYPDNAQLIGIGMWRDIQHLAYDHVVNMPLPLNRVDLVAGHCESVRQLLNADFDIDVFLEPRNR